MNLEYFVRAVLLLPLVTASHLPQELSEITPVHGLIRTSNIIKPV
jgi:hypothetical protein